MARLPVIYTVGHSTRAIGELVELLREHGIRQIADIRTVPRSRHNPQYDSISLARSLRDNGIAYVHLPQLGGLRHAKKDSLNSAWENASFRGFADYMQTPEFEHGVADLIGRAEERATVMLCAEAVPWRCHRSLIADALLVRGMTVMDIVGKGKPREHTLTPWAKVDGTTVTYPGQEQATERKKRRAKKAV